MDEFTLPSAYLRYFQFETKTQRKLLPGLMVSETEKNGVSLVSIDIGKLPPIFREKEILPDVLKTLNLISQLSANDTEKDRMAAEIQRHLFALISQKNSFWHKAARTCKFLLYTIPLLIFIGLLTLILVFLMGPLALVFAGIAALQVMHDADVRLQESYINKILQDLNEVMATVNIRFSNSTNLSLHASEGKSQNLANEIIDMQDIKKRKLVKNISPSLVFFPNKNRDPASVNCKNSFTGESITKSYKKVSSNDETRRALRKQCAVEEPAIGVR